MFTKLLSVSAGLTLSVAGIASGYRQHADQIYRTDREHFEARRVHSAQWRKMVAWFFTRCSGGPHRQPSYFYCR